MSDLYDLPLDEEALEAELSQEDEYLLFTCANCWEEVYYEPYVPTNSMVAYCDEVCYEKARSMRGREN